MIRQIKIPNIEVGYFILALFFILTFGYFFMFGDYILFSQEKQSLFIFSGTYLQEFLIKPGGLLELAGNFLTRFYINKISGVFILSAILTLPGLVLLKINKKLFSERLFSLLFILIPLNLLWLIQTYYYHLMEYNLGFLLVLLYFSITISQRKKYNRYIALGLFPLFLYLAGAYVWLFFGMYILYNVIYEKGKLRYTYALFSLIIAVLSLIVFKVYVFLQPLDQLFQHPLPLVATVKNPNHRMLFYLLAGYLILYPLLGKIFVPVKTKKKFEKPITLASVLIVFSMTIFVLSKLYSPQTNRVFQLQKYVFNQKWNEAIKYHENYPSKNMIGQHFYNVALSETDQLTDRLFYGRQDFGTNSLILPWSNEQHIQRGAYFYYSIGLINEAHRWAYEAMVVYGYRPQNIKLLVKTNLINGNYRMAEKYINMLKRSFNYRTWAKEYEKLLYEPERIQSHPELGEKIRLLPKENFLIRLNNPQNNIPLLLQNNPTNRKALEYKIAWLLLNKNVKEVVAHIKDMKEMGYKQIPQHIEEAALAYYNSTGKLPDLGGFSISQKTRLRFSQYISAYKQIQNNPSMGIRNIRNQFNDTFWYYFHFKKNNQTSN